MDEGLVNEEAPVVDAVEGAHLQNKESEYPSRPESSSMLESRETVMAEGNAGVLYGERIDIFHQAIDGYS